LTKDIEILKASPICKYYKNSILDEDVNWFIDNGFDVYDINVRNWNKRNFHKHLKEELNFPDYYGENLAAFNDCLGDMCNDRYKGVVITFRQYDEFLNNERSSAEAILDILATESRNWLLKGKKLIGLIQSNEPNLELPKLGGISPSWNSAEWMNDSRNYLVVP
jgi:RNAse (barnase) inhibitor barstar